VQKGLRQKISMVLPNTVNDWDAFMPDFTAVY
jgi:hypothetical protein